MKVVAVGLFALAMVPICAPTLTMGLMRAWLQRRRRTP